MYDYYDYSSTADTYNQANDLFSTTMQAAMPMMIVSVIIELVIAVYIIFITWRVFEKAGRKGWESIIPFYNIYVAFTIAGLEWWYLILMFVPFVNIYVAVHLSIELAHRFNKSTAFGFGLLFLNPIFMSILAFEKDTVYTPVDGSSNMNSSNNNNFNNNSYNYNTNQNNMNGYNGMNVNNMNNMNNMNNNGMNQSNNMSNSSNNYGPTFNPTSNTNMNSIPSFNSNNNGVNSNNNGVNSSNNMGINNNINTTSSTDAFSLYGNNNNNSTNNNNTINSTDNNKPLQ